MEFKTEKHFLKVEVVNYVGRVQVRQKQLKVCNCHNSAMLDKILKWW